MCMLANGGWAGGAYLLIRHDGPLAEGGERVQIVEESRPLSHGRWSRARFCLRTRDTVEYMPRSVRSLRAAREWAAAYLAPSAAQ